MKTSGHGLDFLQRREWVPRSPRCGWNAAKGLYFPYRDYKGFWTQGCGHLVVPGEDFSSGLDDAGVLALLARDVSRIEAAVDHHATFGPTQNQYDALVSFGFNEGPDALNPAHHDPMKLLNARRFDDFALVHPDGTVTGEIMKWDVTAGVHDPGLRGRRRTEAVLFCTPWADTPEDRQAQVFDLVALLRDESPAHA